MEFLGAITAGGKVSGSIQKGVINTSLFMKKEGLLQLAMTCSLMASSTFLQFANYMAWPVSTTHSIVGGVIGTGIAAFGGSGILWDFSNCGGVQYDSAGNVVACTTVKKIDATGNSKNTNALDQIPSNGVSSRPFPRLGFYQPPRAVRTLTTCCPAWRAPLSVRAHRRVVARLAHRRGHLFGGALHDHAPLRARQ